LLPFPFVARNGGGFEGGFVGVVGVYSEEFSRASSGCKQQRDAQNGECGK
jgi:hypothetical protein